MPASLVVLLVAVPLSLGIAVASGAPVVAGLISAAIGGIVVGLVGGAPFQVSGPAAGLTVLVAGVIQQFGWQAACLITMAAGALQFAFGLMRIARVALAISPAVVHGMLAGIGVVICLAQSQVVLGGKPQTSALANLAALPGFIAKLDIVSLMLGLLTLGILVSWNRLPEKVRKVPAPLIAVLVPTAIASALYLKVARVDLPEKLLTGLPHFQIPEKGLAAMLTAAAGIALVASVESLLSAMATDRLHKGPKADLDRELIGQGLANLSSGFLGGLPVTGVIVRSSVNIRAGAASKWSTVLHGLWVLVFAVLFVRQMEAIPLCVLAALLVHVGLRLVDLDHIRELATHRELPVYAVTLAGVVFLNLLEGVGLGLGLAIIMLLRRVSRVEVRHWREDGVERVLVDGSLTFLSVPKLTAALEQIQPGQNVEIDLHVDFLDHAAFDALHAWERAHLLTGGKVDIREHHQDWYAPAASQNPKIRKGKLAPTPASSDSIGPT